MSVLTHTYAGTNLLPNQCQGCGVFTNGWAPTYTGAVHEFGGHKFPARGPNYTLCGPCGGNCCGSCGEDDCEFGLKGSPCAAAPPSPEQEGK